MDERWAGVLPLPSPAQRARGAKGCGGEGSSHEMSGVAGLQLQLGKQNQGSLPQITGN